MSATKQSGYTLEEIRQALRTYERQNLKKVTRRAKAATIGNYKLSIPTTNLFFDKYSDVLGQVELQDNQYVFARGQFYKHLNVILNRLNLKPRRNGAIGYLEGDAASVRQFMTLMALDGVGGLITNLSLHKYMSDLTHMEYSHFIREIYTKHWTQEWDQFHIVNFVVQSMCQSCDVDHLTKFTILGNEYTLDTLPPAFLMRLTCLPFITDIKPVCITEGMTPAVSEYFMEKMVKLVKTTHFLAHVDLTDRDQIKTDGPFKVKYNAQEKTLAVDADRNVKMYLHGFKFNSSDSIQKTIWGMQAYPIPDQVDHVFITSCGLSAILYCWVRLKSHTDHADVLPIQPAPTSLSTVPARLDACLGASPYTIKPLPQKSAATFVICSGGHRQSDLLVTCPDRSIFNPRTLKCQPTDPCADKPDGSQIEAADAVMLPKHRRFHLCLGQTIYQTHVCPDDAPYFDGPKSKCVEADLCTFLEPGARYADPASPAAYFECREATSVRKTCPAGHAFLINHCVLEDACFHQPDGAHLSDPADPHGYLKCLKQRSVKRKCRDNHIFSPLKRACVPYNRCHGRANQTLPVPSAILKRSHDAILCDADEALSHTYCADKTQVYDETLRKCRDVDVCQDLKPGKRYPLSDHSFLTCDSPQVPTVVDITLQLDLLTGEERDRCHDSPDGTTKGPHRPPSREYLICRAQRSEVHQCPTDHVFLNGDCQFAPCLYAQDQDLLKETPHDPNAFYYCKRGTTHTFQVTCPEGTRRQGTRCRVDPEYLVATPRKKPRLLDEHSFGDAWDRFHYCPSQRPFVDATQPNRLQAMAIKVNPWIFRCQDTPCSSVPFHQFAFAPEDAHRGVFCIGGHVQTKVDCGSEFFNLAKTYSGDFTLPDCVPQPSWTEEKHLQLEKNGKRLYLNLSRQHAIEHDDFKHAEELRQRSEPVHEGLEAIVGNLSSSTTPKPKKTFRCVKDASRSNVFGYPHSFYNCRSPKGFDTCPPGQTSLGWRCGDILYPVFSDCNLFAIGRSRQRDNYRVFQCPRARPIFSYASQRCEENPAWSTLLCEDAFFQNLELYADPHTLSLPDPVRLRAE